MPIKYLLYTLVLLSACQKPEPQENIVTGIPADSLKITVPAEVMGIAIINPVNNIIDVAAEADGLVRTVPVSLGVPIKKGQLILEMDDALEVVQEKQIQARRNTQQEVIKVEEADLRVLEVKLRKARVDVARNEALIAGKALTPKELDDSRQVVAELQAQREMKAAVIEREKRKLAEYATELAQNQEIRGKKKVFAPIDGMFITLDIEPGEHLMAQTPIGKYAPEGPAIALTEIDELFADRIRIGQKAVVRPQGRSEILTTGTVILAPPYLRKKSLFSEGANNLEDRRVREVRVQLDDATKVLLGSRVECLITL